MKALVGVCTVLYKSFPTTIQQDKALLEELQQRYEGPEQQKQQQQQLHGDDDAVASRERAVTAVQFRLGQKLLLERSTKQLIQRLQELAARL